MEMWNKDMESTDSLTSSRPVAMPAMVLLTLGTAVAFAQAVAYVSENTTSAPGKEPAQSGVLYVTNRQSASSQRPENAYTGEHE
jgi:hypothetical protein